MPEAQPCEIGRRREGRRRSRRDIHARTCGRTDVPAPRGYLGVTHPVDKVSLSCRVRTPSAGAFRAVCRGEGSRAIRPRSESDRSSRSYRFGDHAGGWRSRARSGDRSGRQAVAGRVRRGVYSAARRQAPSRSTEALFAGSICETRRRPQGVRSRVFWLAVLPAVTQVICPPTSLPTDSKPYCEDYQRRRVCRVCDEPGPAFARSFRRSNEPPKAVVEETPSQSSRIVA